MRQNVIVMHLLCNKRCVLIHSGVDDCMQDKKAVLPQGNRAMLQVFFSVEVRQQHSSQV